MSQQYSLRWNNHQPNFISMFTTLLNTQTLVDVTLAAEGKHLQAHKIVLSACSTYFQALFVDNPSQHPIVILKDVSFADLRTMVDFMYCGEVNVTEEQLPQVLDTAKHLKIKGLTEMPETTSLTRSQANELQSQGDSLDSNRHSASPAASPNTKRKRYGIKSSTGSTSLNMVEEHREEQQEPARESVTLSSLPRRREYEEHQNTDPHMNVEPLPMEGGSAGLPQDAASRQRRSKLFKRQSRVQPEEREVRKQVSEPAPPAPGPSPTPSLRKHESYPQYGSQNRTRTLDHEIGSLLIRAVTYIDRQTNPSSASTSFEEAAPATRASHTPAVRNGPPLSCNFCWNTVDECGRILRRKTQYHCPECQTNLCIVPCFHEYHEGPDAEGVSTARSDGVSRRDRVRNSRIRGSLHVRDIADKLQESRLRWYGHVLRKPASYIGNKCLAMPPPPGPGRRGAPKKCWLDVVGADMRANGLTKRDAEDRAKWRRKSRKADPGLRSARAEDATGKPLR
ncbi:longitudinals lacking protein, isoforms H/M/V-like isoform X2 [Leguminivora glycinivorella]|uniref:longitudinals lacking protein, isoforms H/M/V-like isoform X2 n=1 Tax=Leguminivora glycinivorella TaxID=1035111 RepID=UPI00200D88AC|nr:longitudinals lacking protein, isoforms H/M/V-like isoform X2 [Leguminivora glycinivorella]